MTKFKNFTFSDWTLFTSSIAFFICILVSDAIANADYQVSYFADIEASLTLKEVQLQDFKHTKPETTIGYSRAAHWFKVELGKKLQAKDIVVRVSLPQLDDVRLYHKIGDNWDVMQDGDTFPLLQTAILSPRIIFPIQKSEDNYELYLRVETTSGGGIYVQVYKDEDFWLADARYYLKEAIFFSIISSSLIISFALAIFTRDPLYLSYLIAQLVLGAALFSMHGYARILMPNHSTDQLTSLLIIAAMFANLVLHVHLCRRLGVPNIFLMPIYLLLLVALGAAALLFFGHPFFAMKANAAVMALGFGYLFPLSLFFKRPLFFTMHLFRFLYSLYAVLPLLLGLVLTGVIDAFPGSDNLGLFVALLNFVLIFSLLIGLTLQHKHEIDLQRKNHERLEIEAALNADSLAVQSNLTNLLSHVVRTGMTIIKFTIDKVALPAKAEARIDRAYAMIEDTIQKITESERYSQNILTSKFVTLSIEKLIKNFYQESSDRHSTNRIKLFLDEDLQVRGSPFILNIVFQQLIENAIKYSEPETPILLTAHRAGKGGNIARIIVENTIREGLSPNTDRIFERFYRDPSVLDLPGTGAGLHFVANALNALNGTCSFVVEDRKARITLDIPLVA